MKGSYFKEAAGACMALKQYAKAAELYLRGEDTVNAAQAFDLAGDRVQAANLRGEVSLRADRPAEAAAFFQAGADYLRAAELYESQGMLTQAAGAYEAGESWAAAGGVYIRAGLKDRAAASYERAGELEVAARLYEEVGHAAKAMDLYARAGQTFKSGEAAARAGEREKAISLLQRVSASDENYRAAVELLAQLFIESRMPLLALERLQRAIAGQPISSANLDLYYWLALAQESAGQLDEALANHKRILAEDLRFRDVERRAAAIEAKQPMLPVPSATAPPPGRTSAAPTPAPATTAPATPAPAPGSTTTAAAPAGGGVKGARFAVREPLGEGPLGKVFRAEDQNDGRSVALRILAPDLLTAEVQQGLVGDLKAAAQLSHPNLVKLLGLIEHEGQRALVTELVVGKSLAEALRAGRRMPFQQVHTLGRVLAQLLGIIHSRGLVHGSLKPSNVMVSSGVLKLADLGLGRLAQARNDTSGYGPPERGLEPASDLYALAAVMYHLLTGVHPRSQAQGAGLPLPSTLATGVPEAFDKLLLRSLHPRRELRLASADAMLDELKQMVKIG
jgi:serine/threonine-protein kinase